MVAQPGENIELLSSFQKHRFEWELRDVKMNPLTKKCAFSSDSKAENLRIEVVDMKIKPT